jgi:hypothetical protein
VKAEEVLRIVPSLDPEQSVQILPVIGPGPILQIRIGEVREHAPRAPWMYQPPGPSDPVVGCLFLGARCAGVNLGGVL